MHKSKRPHFHPGLYIKEYIDFMKIDVADFAAKLGIPTAVLQSIVDGQLSVDVSIAQKLSDVIGTSVQYWLNLQTAYDED